MNKAGHNHCSPGGYLWEDTHKGRAVNYMVCQIIVMEQKRAGQGSRRGIDSGFKLDIMSVRKIFPPGHALYSMWDLGSPSVQGSNPHSLHWGCRVLTTGPSGKSLRNSFDKIPEEVRRQRE